MRTILISTFVLLAAAVLAQKNGKTWTVKDAGITYQLPDEWRSDPFSTSSVCDCSGTINDNGQWDSTYLGMVTYTADFPIKDSVNRNKVWDYRFESSEAGEKVVINKIEFLKRKGTMNDSKDSNTAWQYVSTDVPGKKGKYIVIYFWGKEEMFKANESVFVQIMKSLKRK